jgi:hypothetical protein
MIALSNYLTLKIIMHLQKPNVVKPHIIKEYFPFGKSSTIFG